MRECELARTRGLALTDGNHVGPGREVPRIFLLQAGCALHCARAAKMPEEHDDSGAAIPRVAQAHHGSR